MGEPHEPQRSSRRDVLKKSAIVAGAAWAAPVLQSVTVPAYAGSPLPPCEDCPIVVFDSIELGEGIFAGDEARARELRWAEQFIFGGRWAPSSDPPEPARIELSFHDGSPIWKQP